NAIDFEQNTAGLDPGDPKLGRALAFAHADFDRLFRPRHIREHADPHAARPLHEAGERTARGFDLTGGDAFRLQRLETVLAEGERSATGRDPVDAALERLAKLGANRLEHDLKLFFSPHAAVSRR